jgi:hypothetical protein
MPVVLGKEFHGEVFVAGPARFFCFMAGTDILLLFMHILSGTDAL